MTITGIVPLSILRSNVYWHSFKYPLILSSSASSLPSSATVVTPQQDGPIPILNATVLETLIWCSIDRLRVGFCPSYRTSGENLTTGNQNTFLSAVEEFRMPSTAIALSAAFYAGRIGRVLYRLALGYGSGIC